MIAHPIHNNLLQFENLNKQDSLLHFTTTANGGSSQGNYTSFNLGVYSGDDLNCVEDNRNSLAHMLEVDIDHLYFPYQKHEDKICVVDHQFLCQSDLEQFKLMHGVDAMITNQKNVCIGVSTADCVPVLIYDPQHHVLAAVHAGWRSTVAYIVPKTIKIMQVVFASDSEKLIVGIAPSISQQYFEVGDEVVAAFSDAGFSMSDIASINAKTGKTHIDLWLANKLLMMDSGILPENIEIAGLCTYSNPQLFFSARRQTIHSGRMVTGGVLL